jgi:malonyl-CoA O-methyltransferase
MLCKAALRASFSRAASSYDDHAGLAQEIAERMLERLDLLKRAPARALDAGSGTGYCARKLKHRYRDCTVVELDFAAPMLQQSRQSAPWWRRQVGALLGEAPALVCADMERLPFAERSFDMVWSNLALLWSASPQQVFAEAWRVLRPGGVYMFSTLGPDTLKELRVAYAAADDRVHVNRFVDMHDLGDALVGARFADPVMDMECLTLTYDEVQSLFSELKKTGSCNVSAGRRSALGGKRAHACCVQAYEELRTAGRLPATFEVVYGQAWKPESARDDGRAVIEFHGRRSVGTE